MRRLDARQFRGALRRAGFVVDDRRQVRHAEIDGGRPLCFCDGELREILADLSVQLHEARARRRGDRFVRTNNFPARVRELVARWA